MLSILDLNELKLLIIIFWTKIKTEQQQNKTNSNHL